MRLTAVLFLFLTLTSFRTLAQIHKYEPGYIIINNDSIAGYIQRTDEIALGKFINFKTDLNVENNKQYYPQDLIGFGFKSDNLSFEKVKVEIREDSIRTELRFAKILLKGYLNLYKLALPDVKTSISASNTFFVLVIKKDTDFFTLGQYENESGRYINTNKRYIGVLNFVLSDSPKFTSKLNNLRFEESPIINLIENYNNSKNDIKTVKYNYKVKPIIKSGIEASFATIVNPTENKVSNGRGYSLGYFWDIQKPDFSKKISTRLGINYLYLTYQYPYPVSNYWYLDSSNEKLTLTQHYLRLPLQGQLNLNNFTSKYCFFLNGGITAQISTTSTFKSVDAIPFLSVGAGVYVSKIKIALLVDNDGFMFDDYKVISLNIGYRLK